MVRYLCILCALGVAICSGARMRVHDDILIANASTEHDFSSSEVTAPVARRCTSYCTLGKACGDKCIPKMHSCKIHKPGKACDDPLPAPPPTTEGSRVQVVLGRTLVDKAIQGFLTPFLENLFSNIKIPDIKLVNDKLILHGLDIETLHLTEIFLAEEVPEAIEGSKTVTTLALRCRASITATTYLGAVGDSKLTVQLFDTELRLNVELFNHEVTGDPWVVVTKIHLPDINDERTTRSLVGSEGKTWRGKLLNFGISVLNGIIMPYIPDGINKWGAGGCNAVLRWPLAVLNQIPLGPGGPCMGTDYSGYWCRSMARLRILNLDPVANFQALNAVISFAPFVHRVRLASVISEEELPAAGVTNTWNKIGPIYAGTPMGYPTVGDKVFPTYTESFQECVKQWPECNSVYGTEAPSGARQWKLGRTMLPIGSGEDRWELCADEGEQCHVTDPAPEMWDMEEKKGSTTPTRFMRIQFRAGGQVAERTAFDGGDGIPCQWYRFHNTRETSKNRSVGSGQCFRLRAETAMGNPEAAITKGNSRLSCPLDLPCVANGMCISTVKTSDGVVQCPMGSIDDWVSKFPLTQPVVVAESKMRFCTGFDMLPCSVTEPWHHRPLLPALNLADPSINSDKFQLRLSTDVLTSALASLYTSGVLEQVPLSLKQINTVSKLCTVTKDFICPAGDPEAIVKLGVISEMPGRVETENGDLMLKLALQLSVYVQTPESEHIPDRELLPPARRCVLQEGAVKMASKTMNSAMFNYSADEYKWLELSGKKLRVYNVNGRAKEDTIDLTGWKIAQDKHLPTAVKLSSTASGAHRLVFPSVERMQEWLFVLTDELKSCDPREDQGWTASAWLSFSVDVKVGVDVMENTLICLRPEKGALTFPYIGKLHYGAAGSWSQGLASAGTRVMSSDSWLLEKILTSKDVVKPMQVYNLNHMGYGIGMQGAQISLLENYISIDGHIKEVAPPAKGKQPSPFDNSPENRCIIPPSPEESKDSSWW